MNWTDLIPIAAAMLAGWAGKSFGQRGDVGGDLPMQKATAPGAALFAAGFAVSCISKVKGLPVDDATIAAKSAEAWLYATGIWSIGKNLVQLVREIMGRKDAAKP